MKVRELEQLLVELDQEMLRNGLRVAMEHPTNSVSPGVFSVEEPSVGDAVYGVLSPLCKELVRRGKADDAINPDIIDQAVAYALFGKEAGVASLTSINLFNKIFPGRQIADVTRKLQGFIDIYATSGKAIILDSKKYPLLERLEWVGGNLALKENATVSNGVGAFREEEVRDLLGSLRASQSQHEFEEHPPQDCSVSLGLSGPDLFGSLSPFTDPPSSVSPSSSSPFSSSSFSEEDRWSSSVSPLSILSDMSSSPLSISSPTLFSNEGNGRSELPVMGEADFDLLFGGSK